MRVVRTGQQVQGSGRVLDRVRANATAQSGSQTQVLQCIGEEIAIHKPE